MTGTGTPHSLLRPSKALFMSEAIDIIGTHLSPPDLFRCILVCRAWNTLFIPHLYDTLNDALYSWPMFLDPLREQGKTASATVSTARKDADWILRTFTKYGHLVRRLYTKRYLFSDAASASQTCTRLISLVLRDAYYPYPYVAKDHPIHWRPAQLSTALSRSSSIGDRTWIGIQWLWRLVQQNSETLQELELQHYAALSAGDGLIDLLASCSRLTTLRIEWTNVSIQALLERMPQLRHYTFDFPYPSSASLFMTSPMSHLVTLRITYGMTKRAFLSLLTNLPLLEKFWTGCRHEDYYFSEGIPPPVDINPAASRLQLLHFTKRSASLPNLDHLMLQEVLPLVPDLVQFGMPYLSPETAAVLAKHCPRAQSFLQTFKKSTIHRERPQGTIVANGSGIVLASCPHLTVFDGLHHEIQAQYLLEYPWSCEGLVILCLQIVGVTRLSEEEEMDYKQGLLFQRTNRTLSEAEVRAVEKYEQQVQEQHRQIYGQLAKLVSLRVLELGMEYRYVEQRYRSPTIQRGAQWYRDYGDLFSDTLELSLSSSLDRLSTLSKLEVFGFESVDHRIEEEELKWMAENWPRLRIMRGLQETEELPLLRHDGEKWHRRVFMQRLRPDVKHEARFKIT